MNNSTAQKQKFHFFKRYILSMTDISTYSTFTREPLSKAFRYFLLLVLMLNIIPFLLFSRTLHNEISDFKTWLVGNTPKMSIKNGVLSSENEQPIKLKYKDFIYLIIDTKDTINRIDPEYDACILLNSRKISLKLIQTTPQTIYIPEDLSLEITPQTLDNYVKKLYLTIVPLAALVIFIVSIMQKLPEIILMALLLSIVYSFFCTRKKIPYAGKFTAFIAACVYAITAPYSLEIILGILVLRFNYFSYVYYLLYLYYVIQVFRKVIIKQPERINDHDQSVTANHEHGN